MLNYTLNQLIKSGVHLGHYKWECDYRLSEYLLGTRNSIHILNIYFTIYILKKLLYITYNMCLINQKMLLVTNYGFKFDSHIPNLDKNKFWYINNKWTGGLLTNQKHLYFYNEKLFFKFYGLGYKSILPSFVFVSNIENCGSSIFEAIVLNIPNSSLLDSNLGYYGIFYGLASNDDNFIGQSIYIKMFSKIYIKSVFDKKKLLYKKKKKRLKKNRLLKKIKKKKIYKKFKF